jgi:hypothetical protein
MRDEMQVKSPVLQIDRSAAFIYGTNTLTLAFLLSFATHSLSREKMLPPLLQSSNKALI